MKLELGDDLGRGWVVRRADAQGVLAQQTTGQAARELGLRVAQALVPAVLTAACGAYVASGGPAAEVVWPVLILLLLVCLLWALDSVRLARRVRRPLAVGAEGGRATGVLAPRGRLLGDYWEQAVSVPREDVTGVECAALPQAAQPPLERWRLSVRLRDGRALLGPELVLDPSSTVHRRRLEALGRALADHLQVPLMPS